MMNSAISSFQDAFDIKGEVGRLVDIATSETLLGADVQQNRQICDKVNAGGKEAAKDAVRTVRKRLKSKNPKVQLLALSVLEALVVNCGPDLLTQVATRETMNDLQSVVLQPNVDSGVHRKTLQLIQAWGEAFKDGRDDFPMFHEAYASLKAQGIRFPEYDPTLAPSSRFQGGGTGMQAAPLPPSYGGQPPGMQAVPPPPQQQQAPPLPAAFDTDRLFADLEQKYAVREGVWQVKMQTGLLTDMLGEVNSKSEDVGENDLIRQLIRNCKIFQPRVMKLVEQVAIEDLIPTLLSVNDDLIRVIERYDEKLQDFHKVGGGGGVPGRSKGGLGATPVSAPITARPAAAAGVAVGGMAATGDELEDLLGTATASDPPPPPARAVDTAELDLHVATPGAGEQAVTGDTQAERGADELDLLGLGSGDAAATSVKAVGAEATLPVEAPPVTRAVAVENTIPGDATETQGAADEMDLLGLGPDNATTAPAGGGGGDGTDAVDALLDVGDAPGATSLPGEAAGGGGNADELDLLGLGLGPATATTESAPAAEKKQEDLKDLLDFD